MYLCVYVSTVINICAYSKQIIVFVKTNINIPL